MGVIEFFGENITLLITVIIVLLLLIITLAIINNRMKKKTLSKKDKKELNSELEKYNFSFDKKELVEIIDDIFHCFVINGQAGSEAVARILTPFFLFKMK